MRAGMKETVPGKKKRPGQDKNIQDWKEENIQRPQVKSNTQPAKRTSSSAGNTGFRFEEWPDEQESSGKRVVSQTPAPPLPSTWEPEYRAKDRLGSTHQSGKFGSQSEQPAVGGISGASEEPGKTGWTGRQRPGWSTDDLFPRETVEAAKLPEAYRGIPEAGDYRDNSRYVPTGNEKKGMTWQEAFLGQWLDTGYDDPVYEVVNGNTDAINKLFSNESVSGSTLMGTDSRFLTNLNDTEKGVYNYLHATQGKEAADRFLLELDGELNARQRKKEEDYWTKEAERNPVGMSVFSVLTKPLSYFSYLQQAEKALSGDKIDPNAGYNRGSYTASAIRGAVSREIESSGKWGKVGSYGYNLAMSMSDFLYTSAITGGMEPLALTIMGTEAAADSVLAAKERGLSDKRSFIIGTAAGVIEAATEKIGFDALFKTGVRSLGRAGFRRYILGNAGAEAAEEGASDLLNWIADDLYDLVTGTDESEFKQLVSVYEENGLDHTKALLSALGDRGKELGLDALGGFLSGLFLSGGKSGYNAIQFNRMGQEAFDTGSYRDYISHGLLADHDSEAYQYAQEIRAKLNAGREVTNIEMGQLTAAVYADALGVGEKRTDGIREEPDEEIWEWVFDEEDDAIQRALGEGLETRTGSEHNREVELSNVDQGDIITPKQLNIKITERGEVVNPMDEEDYDRIGKRLSARGIEVLAATEGDDLRYMLAIGAEGSYSHGRISHIGAIPSRGTLFEEIIHASQAKMYGELSETDFVELYAREIEANRKLLKNKRAYKLDVFDVEDIERNLASWEEKFLLATGVSYDDSNYRG